MTPDGLLRLSRYVIFVDYDAEVEIQHTVRGTTTRVERAVYDSLLEYRGFRPGTEDVVRWIDDGVLVPPFLDTVEHHGGLRPRSEAALAQDHEEWYWAREVEAERSYRWLGQSIVKMPCDLVLYQELIAEHRLESVLEIGYGGGGSLWFFASILTHSGGAVVGVDREVCTSLPPFARFRDVRVDLVHGCAHDVATVGAVRPLLPTGFGLVVIDADPRPDAKLALLERWAPLVAPGGFLVLEDVGSPECVAAALTPRGIDRFLLAHREFGLAIEASRMPFIKARGAVFQALPVRRSL